MSTCVVIGRGTPTRKNRSDPQLTLHVLPSIQEFAELPVRHNEDGLNGELSKKLPWSVGSYELDSPHVKAHLLLQVRHPQVICVSTSLGILYSRK